MRYVAAYLLAALGGNNSPSAKDLEKIIGSVGIEAESDKINKIINELKGKKIEDLIKEGMTKLASVPSGGGAAPVAAAAAAAPAAAKGAAPAPAAAKKEEKKKEESDEDEDMGFGLFD